MRSFITSYGLKWYFDSRINTRKQGEFIRHPHQCYYHSDYSSGGNWRVQGTIENMIWTLKNDTSSFPERLPYVKRQLFEILLQDLPQIRLNNGDPFLTACVIPRSKRDNYYRQDQLNFRQTVNDVISELFGIVYDANLLSRHTNTRTTHLNRNNEGGDGHLPYPGITKDTCHISEIVEERDILLIDDLFTEGINIDEDAIQALLDKGARRVIFYSIGKTLPRNVVQVPAPFVINDLPF